MKEIIVDRHPLLAHKNTTVIDSIQHYPNDLEMMLVKLCQREKFRYGRMLVNVYTSKVHGYTGASLISVKDNFRDGTLLSARIAQHAYGRDYGGVSAMRKEPMAGSCHARLPVFLRDRGWREDAVAKFFVPPVATCRACPQFLRCQGGAL